MINAHKTNVIFIYDIILVQVIILLVQFFQYLNMVLFFGSISLKLIGTGFRFLNLTVCGPKIPQILRDITLLKPYICYCRCWLA